MPVTRTTTEPDDHGERKAATDRLDSIANSDILLGLVCVIPATITYLILPLLTSRYNPIPLPLFDNSPALLGITGSPTVRWDAIHFLSVASGGYQFEQQLAFQPGWQLALRRVGAVWQAIFGGADLSSKEIVRGCGVFMIFLAGARGCLLFRLVLVNSPVDQGRS